MNEPAINPDFRWTKPYGPVTVSQMFDRTAALLRDNPGLFFGIAAVLVGVEVVIGAVLGGGGIWVAHSSVGTVPVARILFTVPLALLGALMIFVFTQIIQGALFLAAQARLANAAMTVGEACRLAAEKCGKLVGIAVLVALRIFGYVLLLYFAFGILAIVPAIMFGGFGHLAGGMRFHPGMGFGPAQLATAGIFMLFALVAILVYLAVLLWLAIRYALAIPAALAENLAVGDAIRRSIHLGRGSKGRLLALFLVVGCAWLAFIAVTVPIQLMGAHAAAMHRAAIPVLPALTGLLRILFSWVLITFTGVATAICYYDLRVRKEGFGGEAATPVLGIPSVPPASGNDWPMEDMPIS